jgi:hypothetical protein
MCYACAEALLNLTYAQLMLSSQQSNRYTSGKRGFHPPPLVPKLFGKGLKGALVPVHAARARPAPSPSS